MLAGVMVVILVSMGMVLLRAVMGPSVFDRILGMNSLATHVVVFIVLLGLWGGNGFYVDIAIIYGLISFITSIAFLMYFKYRPGEE